MQYSEQLRELQKDPVAMGRSIGFDIPDGITNPKEIVMHLVNSGQVRGQMLQRIMPLMNQMK